MRILVNYWEPFQQSTLPDFSLSRNFLCLSRQFSDLEFTLVSSLPLIASANAKFLLQRVLARLVGNRLTGRSLEAWLRFRLVSLLTQAYVRRERADLVLSLGSVPYPWSSQVPHIVYSNLESELYYTRAGKLGQLAAEVRAKRWALRNATAVVTYSEASARRLGEAIPELFGKVHTIPPYDPGVEPIDEGTVRVKQRVTEHLSILFVGGQARRKGLLTLLRGWNLVEPSLRSRASLTVVTPFPPRRGPQSPGVTFVPRLSKQGVIDAMARAQIFVMPTLRDTFGRVLIEAMAQGCCVVSSRQEPQDWILDYGAAGVLVDPESPVEVARGLETLIEKSDLRLDLAVRGRRRFLEVFHHRRVGEQLRQLFTSVVRAEYC